MLIDLDDTLYDEPRVPEWVRTKIDEYLLRELGCPKEEVVDKRTQLFLEYGTTMAGLIATGHAISFDDWHAWVVSVATRRLAVVGRTVTDQGLCLPISLAIPVRLSTLHTQHGTIPYDEWIPARPMLRAILEAIEGPRKWVFTNADEAHAKRCLERLGMDQGLFDGIISFDSIMLSAHKEGLVAPKPGLNGKPGPLYPIVCKPRCGAGRGSPNPHTGWVTFVTVRKGSDWIFLPANAWASNDESSRASVFPAVEMRSVWPSASAVRRTHPAWSLSTTPHATCKAARRWA